MDDYETSHHGDAEISTTYHDFRVRQRQKIYNSKRLLHVLLSLIENNPISNDLSCSDIVGCMSQITKLVAVVSQIPSIYTSKTNIQVLFEFRKWHRETVTKTLYQHRNESDVRTTNACTMAIKCSCNKIEIDDRCEHQSKVIADRTINKKLKCMIHQHMKYVDNYEH